MRINELTGYKAHPVYKAAQGLKKKDPNAPARTWDISYDLQSMRTLTKALQDHGWQAIGHGRQSNVYTNFEYPYMVKVFVNDPAYMKYFNLVKSMQGNRHVPRVRGNVMKVGSQGHAVRLEPLIPIESQSDPIFKQYVRPDLRPTMDNLLDENNLEFLEEHHPELMEVMDQIFDLSSELDWHTGNLMKRGNTLVVTDPIA